MLKKLSLALGIILSAGAVAAAIGYKGDRPAWYESDVLPIANKVIEIQSEITANKLQRANQ